MISPVLDTSVIDLSRFQNLGSIRMVSARTLSLPKMSDKVVYARLSPVNATSLVGLDDYPSLTGIDIGGPDVTDELIESLKRRYPKMQIRRQQ